MEVPLPAGLSQHVEQELAGGRFQSLDELVEQAVRRFFERERGQRRLDALRRLGKAVDRRGLYRQALIPGQK